MVARVEVLDSDACLGFHFNLKVQVEETFSLKVKQERNPAVHLYEGSVPSYLEMTSAGGETSGSWKQGSDLSALCRRKTSQAAVERVECQDTG